MVRDTPGGSRGGHCFRHGGSAFGDLVAILAHVCQNGVHGQHVAGLAEYLQQLAMTPLEQLHQEAQDIYKQFKDQGYTTQEQQQRAAELYQAVQMKEEAAKSGNYDAAKQIIDDIDPTKRMLNMLGGYKEVPG